MDLEELAATLVETVFAHGLNLKALDEEDAYNPGAAERAVERELVRLLPRWYSVHRVGQLRRGQGPAVASSAILGWARVRGGGR
jgi:hypothetical protein